MLITLCLLYSLTSCGTIHGDNETDYNGDDNSFFSDNYRYKNFGPKSTVSKSNISLHSALKVVILGLTASKVSVPVVLVMALLLRPL